MPDAVTLVVPAELQPLLYSRRRHGPIELELDGVSTIGHLIGSVGLPLTEIEEAVVDAQPVDLSWRPREAAVVEVTSRRRPQSGSRFLLDVHLGTLARRMRLLGLDTAWRNDATDDNLISQATAEARVLLTRDRGLLLRRAARAGAYVRGNRPDDQLDDVLDRFAPPLVPWSRCLSCNGFLEPTSKAAVLEKLQPGTRRTYDTFARCTRCGQPYWRGAHAGRLEQIVARYVRPDRPR
jgi:uncharacterized protein with PIN domain